MVFSYRLLVSAQRPHVHLLRLHYLALIGVEDAEVIDRAQRRRQARTFQRSSNAILATYRRLRLVR
jgi:hypothetical protein